MKKKDLHLVIVGGGSTYTLGMLLSIVMNKETLPLKKLTLFDLDHDRQHKTFLAAKVLFEQENYPIEIVEKNDYNGTFEDADFVFMQIRAGGLAMRSKDEKIPLKYGKVGQETCGPGGIAYGLRSVPAIIDIVKNIRKQAPEAWIMNYSNPAAIVAEGTRRAFPNDHRIINMCDMPLAIMCVVAGAIDFEVRDFSPRYFGLNHFGWFTHLYDKEGNDKLPGILDLLRNTDDLSTDNAKIPALKEPSWRATFKQLTDMVKDLHDNKLPNTYFQYYFYPEKMAKHEIEQGFTRADEVIAHRQTDAFAALDRIAETGKVTKEDWDHFFDRTHDQYILDATLSILHNRNDIFILITENNGTIENMPDDAMVEVSCVVNKNGLEPLKVGKIPIFYQGLMTNQLASEKMAVDAIFEHSKNKLVKALMLNRAVNDVTVAKALAEDLIEANKKYWPELK